MTAALHYTVRPGNPAHHRFAVKVDWAGAPSQPLVFRLPAWIRGSYLVRDMAKHVEGLRAWRDGQEIGFERLDKSSFRLPAGTGPVRLEYAVFAFDASVRKAFLDTRRGFFNGSSLFYAADCARELAAELRIERPLHRQCADWKVATSMTAVEVDADGFGRYRSADYEELIDHPFELGNLSRTKFEVDGIVHELVLSGRYTTDPERITQDLTRICKVERELFGGEPQLDRYLFLTHVVGAGYGGLEHRSSTALVCSRGDLPKPGDSAVGKDYRTFLGLCSHEYFHLWNVKRITAQRFAESDLSREAYTRDLWHYEGVTSYYDDLFLLRAGLIDAPVYLDILAEHATRLQRNPSRRRHSLADASFETWIKFYQPDENAPNASTNYYVKGALAALCLDLRLRRDSAITLDEVMRELWRRYGVTGQGVPEGGLEALAGELSGLDLRAFFDRLLRSTEELPLVELLDDFGVRAEPRACSSAIDDGGRTLARGALPWVGMRFKPGDTQLAYVLDDGPAQEAGLSPGDQLIALDGLKLTAPQWNRRLEAMNPGVPVAVHFFRGDELFETALVPQKPPLDTWAYTLAEVEGQAAERRRSWLGA